MLHGNNDGSSGRNGRKRSTPKPLVIDGKTQSEICQLFLQGKCKFGPKCHRIHPETQLQSTSQSAAPRHVRRGV